MSGEHTKAEFLAHAMAGLFAGMRSLAIGANSPIPAAAALLAQAREPGMFVSLLGSPRHNPYPNGGTENFDLAAEGRLDGFVIGGAQIDGQANINLVAAGEYAKPSARFAGSFGSAFIFFTVPRVILFREEHTPRVLVPKVDFISAPGASPPGVFRRGGPTHLLTGKALFAFDRARARFALQSVHPGNGVQDIVDATGFDFDRDAEVPVTPAPAAADLALLRGRVREELADAYPEFAREAFAV